jgi:tetratricopeptide (TPR) repeat protein
MALTDIKNIEGGRISIQKPAHRNGACHAPLRQTACFTSGRTTPLSPALVFTILCLAAASALHAQSAPGNAAGAEIQKLEQAAARSGASNVERGAALAHLARIRQLSGNFEDAAKNWLDAAAADPSNEDAPVFAAFCLAAMGEWQQAQAAIRQTLSQAHPGNAFLRACYLNACAEAWRFSSLAPLNALAENSAFGELRPAIYYTLWKLIDANPGIDGQSDAAYWRSRLLTEFPRSPEGRLAAAEDNAVISALPSPLWLLLPGFGSYTLARETTPPAKAASAVPPPAAPPVQLLQTGLFSREENAQAHAGRLNAAGFSHKIRISNINGVDHWVVTVPAGTDMNQTIIELNTAGFESFPVF